MAALAMLIGYSGAATAYYSANGHPSIIGLSEYLLKWGSGTAVVVFVFLANIVLPPQEKNRAYRNRDRVRRLRESKLTNPATGLEMECGIDTAGYRVGHGPSDD
jgi:hypothetical protein